MAQDIATSSYCSVIQVDKDISFVLDNRDIDFALAIPTDKQIGMSRKTYSKKHPITYPSVPVLGNSVNDSSSNGTPKGRKSSLKNTPKCTSAASPKNKIRRKRPLTNSSKIPVPRKVRKKELSNTKVPLTKINGRIANKFEKSSQSIIPSQDSEIEIIEVIERNTSKAIKRDSMQPFNGKESSRDKLNDMQKRKNCKSLSNILKPCYPSNNDVPTEADIAPVIPSNSVIPDTSISETNQDIKLPNKWVLPVSMSRISSVQNIETHSAKESAINSADTFNLFDSEIKIPHGRKFAGRELKNLYANLNEIYWAKEKNFKQMISSTDRHSDRITAKAVDVGKNLRRLKAKSGTPVFTTTQKKALAKKNSAKIALKRAKFGRLKPKLVLKKDLKPKSPVNKVNRKALTKQVSKPTKKLKVATKSKNAQQPKAIVKNKAIMGLKQKSVTQTGLKQKAVTELKQKDPMPSSSKITKITGAVSKSKPGNSSQIAGKSIVPSALKRVVKTENGTQVISKSTSDRKILKKFEYSDEVNYFRKSFGDNKVYTTAMKKGSKLRVHVEPLEHTTLWNSDFCEAFSKYVIEQSSSQLETKNKESIKAMFEELMDSWYNNPSEDSKLSKRKKPEEETLRSSVRQSEGAFRYKEIVVKKHENYMQFILVPNAVKQNSLSIEAMKELKDAFLLAKKDPNCRAVLFNSSGTFFCTGIDMSQLVGNNKKQLAEEMATTIMDLVLTLSMFTKPIVAAVNGTAVGFGVALLTYCDVVLASDKATFCIPATRLGYLPEGGLTYTLPPVTGATVATELLLYGRRLTADQALRHGLVSEVLWHSNLMNEVVPRVQVIVSQPLQVMEATKTMVRCQLWDRLRQHLDRELRLQPPLWLHAQCQSNMKKALQTGWLID